MATMQEVLDRAIELAAGIADGPLHDADVLAETLLPRVLENLGERVAAKGSRRILLRQTLQVAVTNNIGLLPDNALSQYICEADVVDVPGDRASVTTYSIIVRSPDDRLAWLAMKEGFTFHYLPVGGGIYTDDVFITMPCVPVVPAASTDPLIITAELLDEAISDLANAILSAGKVVV